MNPTRGLFSVAVMLVFFSNIHTITAQGNFLLESVELLDPSLTATVMYSTLAGDSQGPGGSIENPPAVGSTPTGGFMQLTPRCHVHASYHGEISIAVGRSVASSRPEDQVHLPVRFCWCVSFAE